MKAYRPRISAGGVVRAKVKTGGSDFKPRVEARIQYVPWIGGQTRWHLSDARIKVAVTGARAGKTISAAAETIDRAIRQVGYLEADRSRGIPYTLAVGAPDYPMIERVVLPTILRMMPEPLRVGRYNQQRHLLKLRGLRGETWIYFISAKTPESWQGQELYGVWLDEFCLMKETMYDEAQTRLSSRSGWMLLTSTPRGPNWAKTRLYDHAQTSEGAKEIFFISWRTVDNPYYPRERLEEFRRTMPPKYFRRNFEASWDVYEGQIFDELSEAVHVVPASRYRFVLPGMRRAVGVGPEEVLLDEVIAGVDWGFSNPGAIVVVGRSENDWIVLDESYGREVLVTSRSALEDSWVRRALAMRARWGVAKFYCDPESREYVEQFVRAGIQAQAAENAVHPGLTTLIKLLHVDAEVGVPRLRILDTCSRLFSEMTYYHWRPRPRTGEPTEEPEKVDDHAISALRYAIHSHTRHGRFRREPMYQMS